MVQMDYLISTKGSEIYVINKKKRICHLVYIVPFQWTKHRKSKKAKRYTNTGTLPEN